MKKLISIALAAALCTALTVPAAAITTGRWDLSGIQETIQRVAEETEPEIPENSGNYPISDVLLEQIYAAIRAQREAALRFFAGDRKGRGR